MDAAPRPGHTTAPVAGARSEICGQFAANWVKSDAVLGKSAPVRIYPFAVPAISLAAWASRVRLPYFACGTGGFARVLAKSDPELAKSRWGLVKCEAKPAVSRT